MKKAPNAKQPTKSKDLKHKGQMNNTPHIKTLFQFIEFLHSNIENFNQYDYLANELKPLTKERNKLKPKESYWHKLRYKEIQAEIESKYNTFYDNTIEPIKAKAVELGIFSMNKPDAVWASNAYDELEGFDFILSENDLPELLKYKQQYIEYRTKAREVFLLSASLIGYLYKLAEKVFDYFKKTDYNEFEVFGKIDYAEHEDFYNEFAPSYKEYVLSESKPKAIPPSNEPLPPQPNKENEPLPPQPIVKKPITYGANEYALAYIFDLYAIGQQVPVNRIEGSLNAKKIKEDVSKFPNYEKAPDTFYRAVKKVLNYDLNKPTDLLNISKDWLNAVRNLSPDWKTTEQYLKNKELIKE